VLVAGRRFGKTVLALTWLVTEVMRRGRGALGYYVAPFRVMAKAIAWDLLLLATRELRVGPPNASELTVRLPGGRRIALKGADDPETLEGVGLVAVVMDEFGRMKLDAWQKSIRPALSDKQGRALICGKPRGHNHLKDFYERGQGATARADWRSWLYRTIDGGFVPTEDIAEARTTLPAKVYRQEYEATFESLAGRVYEDFTRRTHVRAATEFARAAFRQKIVGVDWGFTAAGVMLLVGRTGAGRRVVLREEVHTGKHVADPGWLSIASDLRASHGPLDGFAADPSESGYIAALRGHLNGRPVVYGADNRRHEGIRRVSVALQPMVDGDPGLLVSDACPHTIRELETYVFKEVGGRTTEEPVDADDHCMDALRYAEMALPPLSHAA
jgi:hypothetical protein